MTTATAMAAQFARDGLLILRPAPPPGGWLHLCEQLEASLEEVPPPQGAGAAYEQRFDVRVDVTAAPTMPEVTALFAQPDVVEATTAVLGDGWQPEGPPLIFSTPRGGMQGWHQDTSDPDPTHFFINRIVYPRGVVAAQGALYVVPGSHRRGDIPPGENHGPLDGALALLPEPGSLVFLHGRCWHRVGINDSDLPRTQVNWRARPATAPTDLGRMPVFRTGRWDFRTGTEITVATSPQQR